MSSAEVVEGLIYAHNFLILCLRTLVLDINHGFSSAYVSVHTCT